MITRRAIIIGLILGLAVVPMTASALPKLHPLMIGQVQGDWCYGPSSYDCFHTWGSDQDLSIWWLMDGTWAKAGKTIRATSDMQTTGTKIAPSTYRLATFRYDVYDRRSQDDFQTGWCDGTAQVRAVISIDVQCHYYEPYAADPTTFDLHVRAINERKANDAALVVVPTIDSLAGIDSAFDPACPEPFDGLYY